MDPHAEQKVMQSFYDRIFQMVTYSPNGQSIGREAHNTLVQLVKDRPINPKDYAKAITFTNPKGDMTQSQALFNLTDIVGGMDTTYEPSTKRVAATYKDIVDGANSSTPQNPKQLALYNRAANYLHEMSKTPPDMFGHTKEVSKPTPVYATYKFNQTAYARAVSAYRNAYLSYDMTKRDDQLRWEANAPLLQNAIDQTWEDWVSGGKAEVEQALSVMQTSVNDAVRNIIIESQAAMKDRGLASFLPGNSGGDWYLTMVQPSNWWDASVADNWVDFTLTSNYLYTDDESRYHHTDGSAGSSFLGIVSWGGSGASTDKEHYYHMEGNNLRISCKLMTVTIDRPWMNDDLFSMKDWYFGSEVNLISNGLLDASNATKVLPIVPTAFVVATDVSITANWTTKDTATISKASNGGGAFKFGPFHAGGGGKSKSGSNVTKSSFNGGTLRFDGMQMVAMVNQVIPACAPQAPPN